MKIRRFWWVGAIGVVMVLVGTLLALPAWAAPTKQVDDPAPDAYAAMHEACEAGDVQGMEGAMDSLSDEDWQAMGEHMNGEGHHGASGSGMMGMGGMMGGWSGSSSGWSSMMSW